MTENKRFEICGEGSTNLDVTTYIVEYGDGYDDCFELYESKEDSQKVCDKINNILDENEQLKDKYNEQSVQYEGLEEQVERLLDFKDNVFILINAKIKHYSHKPISAPAGQPLSVNFDADVDRLARLSELQQLKEELQRND